MNFKISITYDGNHFHGWEGVGPFRYIKDTLQESLSFTKENLNIVCAARTDRGVHARSNTCSFELQSKIPSYNLMRAMNYYLPHYIRVNSIQEVTKDFNARFSASGRHYKFLISSCNPNPLLHKKVWFTTVKKTENVSQILDMMTGVHNFSSFCPTKTDGNKHRTITQCYIDKIQLFNTDIYEINIIARSFLHHQVRNIIGSCIDFDKGKISAQEIEQSLREGKKITINMAPAFGLYLWNVLYQ